MIKLTGCVKRLPNLSLDEFDRYWRETHASLVRSHAGLLRIRRYVQTTTLADPTAQERIRATRHALEAGFDGYAELWWDSLDTLDGIRSTGVGAAALRDLLEDEARFVDLANSRFWFGTEREIVVPE